MYPRSLMAGLTLAVGSLGIATMATAAQVIDVEIATPPPSSGETTVIVTPAVREGFIYEPGHFAVDGDKYVWVDGRYIALREGHRWVPYVIEQRGDKWHYRAGHWDDD
jgi:hypothetical protein